MSPDSPLFFLMPPLRLAIVGVRHRHIFALLQEAAKMKEIQLVAICEENTSTRKAYAESKELTITHSSIDAMLASTPCDIIGIGDYYGRRGALAIQSLRAGRHVLADKPLCTTLAECDKIQELSQKAHLKVGCMFGLRWMGPVQLLRKKILDGAIGQVRTINITGQHPLMLKKRPGWYFEPGKHGGTINDIGVHAIEAVQWLTGGSVVEVTGARVWNGKASATPWFKDCAQFMLRLSNDVGVISDVSYLSPDAGGFGQPQNWRITVHGDDGVLECNSLEPSLTLVNSKNKKPHPLKCPANQESTYLHDFLAEIKGEPKPFQLTTPYVLRTTRTALQIQQAADQNKSFPFPVK